MEKNKYTYLEKYKNFNNRNVKIWKENTFIPVTLEHINVQEEYLGFKFPNALKEFWISIGYGHLTTPFNKKSSYECLFDNKILSPRDIAEILLLKEESGLILPEYAEYLEPGEMPFFEIADSSNFLIMKPLSDNPNAVYSFGGRKIEDSFERFIYRLYYESPTYYLNVDEESGNE